MHDWNNTPNQQHVMSFYMDATEVTNMMYLEYLDWVKTNFPPSNINYADIYNGVLPDTLVWRNRLRKYRRSSRKLFKTSCIRSISSCWSKLGTGK